MRRFVQPLLVALALSALVLPATAPASGRDVIRDCADDGKIDGNYSDAELRDAERDLPSDIDEYTDCREAIRAERARKRNPDGGGSNGGPGGGLSKPGGSGGPVDPALVTADGAVAGSHSDLEDFREAGRASRSGRAPAVGVGDGIVTPGETSGGKLLGVAGASNDLPGPIVAVLVLLAALLVGGIGTLGARRRPAAGAVRALAWTRRLPGTSRGSLRRIFKR